MYLYTAVRPYTNPHARIHARTHKHTHETILYFSPVLRQSEKEDDEQVLPNAPDITMPVRIVRQCLYFS